jgi:hypothetical protein
MVIAMESKNSRTKAQMVGRMKYFKCLNLPGREYALRLKEQGDYRVAGCREVVISVRII